MVVLMLYKYDIRPKNATGPITQGKPQAVLFKNGGSKTQLDRDFCAVWALLGELVAPPLGWSLGLESPPLGLDWLGCGVRRPASAQNEQTRRGR